MMTLLSYINTINFTIDCLNDLQQPGLRSVTRFLIQDWMDAAAPVQMWYLSDKHWARLWFDWFLRQTIRMFPVVYYYHWNTVHPGSKMLSYQYEHRCPDGQEYMKLDNPFTERILSVNVKTIVL